MDIRALLRAGRSMVVIGDNLDVLRDAVDDASVDLVYLDPPFNSRRDYHVVSSDEGAPLKLAFSDSWRWDDEAEAQLRALCEAPGVAPSATVGAFLSSLGATSIERDVLAYLVMMAPRLIELRRVLKPAGSLYLHCDPTASHYLKVVLDLIFGADCFRREIVWRSGWVSGFKSRARNWVRNHDVLLYYVRDAKAPFTFHKDLAYRPHPPGYTRRGGGGNTRGVAIDDVWDENAMYSPWIKSFSKEKLGFMTQKPRALLERIVSVSSSEGELVLDPFLGGGTTAEVAHRLGRRWLGIDKNALSAEMVERRFRDLGDEPARYLVEVR